jgi:hypothetical protein
MQAFRARRGEPGVGEWLLIAGLSLAALTGVPQIIEALRGAQLVSEQPLSEGERWRLGLGGVVQLAVALAGVRIGLRSLGRRGSGGALLPRTLASRVISEGRQIRGKFPPTASANEILYRADTRGRITHYQVYGADGLPVMRVDVTGKPHGGVAAPHVIEFQRHRAPDGTIYVRPSRKARTARADEIP